jgi:chromosome partitioning protein
VRASQDEFNRGNIVCLIQKRCRPSKRSERTQRSHCVMASRRRPLVIAVYNSKGGVGKSTLTVHLAVAAQQAGESVAIIDTDPQESSMTWGRARLEAGRATPAVVAVSSAQLDAVLEAAAEDNISLVVIDTPPHAGPGSVAACDRADLIVLPVRPSMFDLAAVGKAVRVVQASKKPAVFVFNGCPARSPAEVNEAAEALAVFGYPVAPVRVVDRRAFARALASGRAVTEFEINGRAAGEIRELWHHIEEALKHGKQDRRAG